MGRFIVIEYLSQFAVRDTHTGQEPDGRRRGHTLRRRGDADLAWVIGLLRSMGLGPERRRRRDACGVLHRTRGPGEAVIAQQADATNTGVRYNRRREYLTWKRRMATDGYPSRSSRCAADELLARHRPEARHAGPPIAVDAASLRRKRLDELLFAARRVSENRRWSPCWGMNWLCPSPRFWPECDQRSGVEHRAAPVFGWSALPGRNASPQPGATSTPFCKCWTSAHLLERGQIGTVDSRKRLHARRCYDGLRRADPAAR